MRSLILSLVFTLVLASGAAMAEPDNPAASRETRVDPKPAVGSKAEALVDLALDGFGGEGAVKGTSSIVCHGNADDPATGRPGTYSHYITGEGNFRLDMVYGTESLARSRFGRASYHSGGGRLVRVEDEDDWRMYFEQKSLGLPFGLLDPYKMEYSGMGYIEGKRYEKLVLYHEDGPALLVVLDGKTGHVKRTFMDTGEGPEGVFEMRFSDYSEEGELVLPHSFSQYVGGREVLSVKLVDFTFNTEVSPHLFKP